MTPSIDHEQQLDHDRLVRMETVLTGYNGQNGMRGQLKSLEAKHDALDTKVDERFQKLFSRIWWVVGGIFAGSIAIVAAIIETHPH